MGHKNKSAIVNELSIGDNQLSNSRDIAEGFNEFFSNIGPDLSSKIDTSNYNFLDYMQNAKLEFTQFELITVDKLYHLLKFPVKF